MAPPAMTTMSTNVCMRRIVGGVCPDVVAPKGCRAVPFRATARRSGMFRSPPDPSPPMDKPAIRVNVCESTYVSGM